MSEENQTPETEDEVRPLSIFDICETDTDAEENGRWFNDIFENETGIDIKLRRMTSKKSIQARRRLDRVYKGKMNKKGEYDEETGLNILVEQMAEGVLADWRGVYDRDGTAIPYSKEKALELMRKLPALRDACLIAAQDIDNFRIQDAEDAEKN